MKIFLMMIGFSLVLFAEFNRDNNGIVTDTKTKLQWQDDYTDNAGIIKKPVNWEDAIGYCEGLSLGDLDDWRLPNQNELLSIVDHNQYNPAISTVFQNTELNYPYWSATTMSHTSTPDNSYVWTVEFYEGKMSGDRVVEVHKPSAIAVVRCVRAGE